MAMIAAKCTQCGENITVDDGKDAGICEFCGTPFVTEKVINNYNTNVIHNYEGATVHINKGNAENFIKRAFLSLEFGEWEKVDGFFEQALSMEPEMLSDTLQSA